MGTEIQRRREERKEKLNLKRAEEKSSTVMGGIGRAEEGESTDSDIKIASEKYISRIMRGDAKELALEIHNRLRPKSGNKN